MRLARVHADGRTRLVSIEQTGDARSDAGVASAGPWRGRTIDHCWDDAVTALLDGAAAVRAAAAEGELLVVRPGSLAPPIERPGKLLCAAMNFHEHVAEINAAPFVRERIVPKLFLKPSSSLLGPYDTLRLPHTSDEVDWELELAVVIGRRARDVEPAAALDHVIGYTVINDISARSSHWAIGERAPSHWDNFFDWLMGKWADGFAPFGPWLVSVDDVPDPQDLHLQLWHNGTLRQDGRTSQMIFSVAELIAFASTFMTLEPGDVIATGTPSGVGAATGTYLRPGDIVRGTIAGIGTIETNVVGA